MAGRRTALRCGIAAVLLCGMPGAASDRVQRLRPGAQQFGIWAGFSPASPTLIGTAADRKFALFALRYGIVVANPGPVAVEYVADLMPITLVIQPQGAARATVPGFAFAPVGFRWSLGPERRWQPFAEATGGMIRTQEPVPYDIPGATRWNFMFDIGGGIQRMMDGARAVRFGYRYHHISNAYRTEVNPGLDAHILYVGFTIFR